MKDENLGGVRAVLVRDRTRAHGFVARRAACEVVKCIELSTLVLRIAFLKKICSNLSISRDVTEMGGRKTIQDKEAAKRSQSSDRRGVRGDMEKIIFVSVSGTLMLVMQGGRRREVKSRSR